MNATVSTFLKKVIKTSCYMRKFSFCGVVYNASQALKVTVEPFWKLDANLNNCDLHIKSCDPIQDVDGNILKVETYSNQANQSTEIQSCNVSVDESLKCVFVTNHTRFQPNVIRISTHPAFDFNLNLHGDSSLSISNIESIVLSAHVENGNVTLHNIKAQEVTSSAENGAITSTKILQGNVELKAKSIQADKIQSPSATVVATDGEILLKNVYTEKFSATTKEIGDVTIQSLHGDSEITSDNGNIHIGTTEGNIHASSKHGNINLHIARSGNVHLSSETGDIFVSLPQDAEVPYLELSGRNISSTSYAIDENTETELHSHVLGQARDDQPQIKVISKKGSVKIERSSWMQRINEFRKQFMAS